MSYAGVKACWQTFTGVKRLDVPTMVSGGSLASWSVTAAAAIVSVHDSPSERS